MRKSGHEISETETRALNSSVGSVGSERLRSGCNLSSDQGETVYGLAEIFFVIRWLVAWGDGWLEIGTDHDHRFSIQDGGQVRFLQGDGQETSS